MPDRSESVAELAAEVVHQLNTPLGAVLVAVDMALSCLGDNPEQARRRLDKALLAVEQMQTVLTGLSQRAWEGPPSKS